MHVEESLSIRDYGVEPTHMGRMRRTGWLYVLIVTRAEYTVDGTLTLSCHRAGGTQSAARAHTPYSR